MKIEFDPTKNSQNIHERGLSFEQAHEFNFESALFEVDDRKDYGEIRFRAFGYFEQRLHTLVFTAIKGGIRVISFRKANNREVKHYESKT
jgi:uncharacterized protein